jgi:hypothetical protein
MNILALKDRLRIRLPGLKRASSADVPAQAIAVPSSPAVQVARIEKHTFAFGLDWRFFTDRKDLGQALRGAKRDGFSHHVVNQTEDLVGLARLEKGAVKGPLHCASLQLVQSVSQGGVELFVFHLDQDVYSLIALNDSRPILDFERIGSRSEILALAGEFQLAQVGHTIRQAGNTGVLEHEEPIKLSEAFGRLDETTRFKVIPDYKLLFIGLAVAVGLGLAVHLVYRYINAENIKQQQALEARERDPNFVYEKGIDASMKEIGLPASIQLERWRTTLRPIPLSRQGWTLTSIVCMQQECKLAWNRSYGNFLDFYAAAQANEVSQVESQDAGNPASSRIETTLKVSALPEGTPGLDRQNLPELTGIQRPLSSQLQDLSLLPNSSVSMNVPVLFPAADGVSLAQINKPVVRAEWSFTHELWSLDEVNFTHPSLVLDSFTLAPDEKSGQWNYSLKGHYYAKGKAF